MNTTHSKMTLNKKWSENFNKSYLLNNNKTLDSGSTGRQNCQLVTITL